MKPGSKKRLEDIAHNLEVLHQRYVGTQKVAGDAAKAIREVLEEECVDDMPTGD